MTRFTAFHLKAGSCICWIFKRSFCHVLTKPVQVCSLSAVNPFLSRFRPLSPLLAFVTSPFFPGARLHLGPPLLHSPFIKFYGKLEADKHAEFPQSQPHSFSSSQSPAASAATSNYISSLPSLYPLLSVSPSLTSSSHRFIKLSPLSLKFQCMCHATPVTPTPCVTAFYEPELLLILILSGCRLA